GDVRDASGAAAEGLRVELRPRARGGAAEAGEPRAAGPLDAGVRVQPELCCTETGPGGRFAFGGLAAGRHELRAARDAGALARAEIAVEAGAERGDLELALDARALTLVGRVRTPAGPAAGARIEVHRYGRLGTVLTDAQGTFRIAGLDADDA